MDASLQPDQSIQCVTQYGRQMESSLKSCNYIQAISHASDMLKELKTLLPPKSYFDLFGASCVKSSEFSRNEILSDLVEMCLGVQHPLRGLFLRNFLLQSFHSNILSADDQYILPKIQNEIIASRDVMAQQYLMDVIIQVFPDDFHLATLDLLLEKCGYLQPGVRISPIICTLIQRLTGYLVEELRSKRQLNMSHLLPSPVAKSNAKNNHGDAKHDLDNDDLDNNSPDDPSSKLPPIDQGIEDEEEEHRLFDHLLHLVSRLLTRKMPDPASLIDSHRPRKPLTSSYQDTGKGFMLYDLPTVYAHLLNLALWLDHVRTNNDNQTSEWALQATDSCFNALACQLDSVDLQNLNPSSFSREVCKFLQLPVTYYGPSNEPDIDTSKLPEKALIEMDQLISLPGFFRLVGMLEARTTRPMLAAKLMTSFLDRALLDKSNRRRRFTSIRDLDNLLSLVDGNQLPRRHDDDDSAAKMPVEFCESASLLTHMIHVIGPVDKKENVDQVYQLLVYMRQRLTGTDPILLKSYLGALVFESIELLRAINSVGGMEAEARNEHINRLVDFIHQCVETLTNSSSHCNQMALLLLLQVAEAFDRVEFDRQQLIVYEFVSQALNLFEVAVSRSRDQLALIGLICATIGHLRCFEADNRETLRKQCLRTSLHLLRRADQSRAVAMVASVYWPMPRWFCRGLLYQPFSMQVITKSDQSCKAPIELPPSESISEEQLAEIRDADAVVATLQRSAKLANECIDLVAKCELLVDNLDASVVLRIKQCPTITDQLLKDRVSEIDGLLAKLPSSTDSERIKAHCSRVVDLMSASSININ